MDYLGLADQLKKAMANYTQAGGKGQPIFDQDAAIRKMLEHFDVVRAFCMGSDYSKHLAGQPPSLIEPKTHLRVAHHPKKDITTVVCSSRKSRVATLLTASRLNRTTWTLK